MARTGVFEYIVKRVLWALMLFFVVTIVTYVIFFVIPVNPARQACGQRPSNICIESTRRRRSGSTNRSP